MDEQAKAGSWYETNEGETFMVLAVGKASGVIDVQFLNGRTDQYDGEVWSALQACEIEPPQEWHASMDDFLSGRRLK